MSAFATGGLVLSLAVAGVAVQAYQPAMADACSWEGCAAGPRLGDLRQTTRPGEYRPLPLYQTVLWHTREAAREERARVRRAAVEGRRRLQGRIALWAAWNAMGTPYSWGGGDAAGPTFGIEHGADTFGFDCSGLTLYAWAQAGIRLGHYTGTQFRQGDRVPVTRLRPGDLVFFGEPRGVPNHVGLNVGHGVMIHAPQTGDVVRATSFAESPYYSSRYRGAVRPAVRAAAHGRHVRQAVRLATRAQHAIRIAVQGQRAPLAFHG
ncbi:hypothetical protein Misp01_23940 [Microtetraspora sp. NBRC 13810]|nr:hypothetical protein Misp01_23940 [Microtetraspora sp. NBRC 13810]